MGRGGASSLSRTDVQAAILPAELARFAGWLARCGFAGRFCGGRFQPFRCRFRCRFRRDGFLGSGQGNGFHGGQGGGGDRHDGGLARHGGFRLLDGGCGDRCRHGERWNACRNRRRLGCRSWGGHGLSGLDGGRGRRDCDDGVRRRGGGVDGGSGRQRWRGQGDGNNRLEWLGWRYLRYGFWPGGRRWNLAGLGIRGSGRYGCRNGRYGDGRCGRPDRRRHAPGLNRPQPEGGREGRRGAGAAAQALDWARAPNSAHRASLEKEEGGGMLIRVAWADGQRA